MFRRHPFLRAQSSLFASSTAILLRQVSASATSGTRQQPHQHQPTASTDDHQKTAPKVSKRYATGLDAISEEAWGGAEESSTSSSSSSATTTTSAPAGMTLGGRKMAYSQTSAPEETVGTSTADVPSTTASSTSDEDGNTKNKNELKRPAITSDWMAGAEWASIGEEFKGLDSDKFLKRVPEGFLTQRAVTDIRPAEELLSDFVAIIDETYKGVDVRDPSSVTKLEGERPSYLTMGGKVRAVSEFISGHLAHQVSLPEWQNVFDLKHMEMDLMYWLWVIHLHLVARRATSVKILTWSRRREVLEELSLTMFASWTHTSEEVMGRPPLSKIRNYIKDMYYVTAINLEEALMHDGPGGDLKLLGVLVKFCPLPRPEDIPLYSYYTLVHYIRFHMALFDRISDEEVSKGNFNFFSPSDPAIFKSYSDIEFDGVIREWKARGHENETAEEQVASEEKKKEEEGAGQQSASEKEQKGEEKKEAK